MLISDSGLGDGKSERCENVSGGAVQTDMVVSKYIDKCAHKEEAVFARDKSILNVKLPQPIGRLDKPVAGHSPEYQPPPSFPREE